MGAESIDCRLHRRPVREVEHKQDCYNEGKKKSDAVEHSPRHRILYYRKRKQVNWKRQDGFRRGDIYLADLNRTALGSEQHGV